MLQLHSYVKKSSPSSSLSSLPLAAFLPVTVDYAFLNNKRNHSYYPIIYITAKPNNCGKPKVLKISLIFWERVDFRPKKPPFLQKKREILEKKKGIFFRPSAESRKIFRKPVVFRGQLILFISRRQSP